MRHADAQEIAANLPFDTLISMLHEAAKESIHAPPRQIVQIDNESKLLMMPAHSFGSRMGVKIISVYDANRKKNLETIQGLYCLFNSENGQPIMTLDAAEITARRTAATSALAARMLANADANLIAIAGAGKLLPYFVEAYSTIRPQCAFRLWARNYDQLRSQKKTLERITRRPIEVFETFQEAISGAQIISTITSARNPILCGDWLEKGVHIDLVGAHTKEMREADTACFERAKIFVDCKKAALEEAGDLLFALQKGKIQERDIVGDLFGLASGQLEYTRDPGDITLFKSVGHAFEDLVAATLVEERINAGN